MYCWARNFPQKNICHECGLAPTCSYNTIIDWCNFCRDVCEEDILQNQMEIGGIDEDGNPLVVEIDETKFFYRKYHGGEWRPGHWVFGGMERGTGRCFMVEVENWSADTLLQLIKQFILPGTHIISDGWHAYQNIVNLNNGVYTHSVINHSENFVDPADEDIHTQSVENFWMRAKRKMRRQFGTSEDLFPTYLSEFMWRNRLRGGVDVFSEFLISVGRLYAV